jgi:hypothetical protein
VTSSSASLSACAAISPVGATMQVPPISSWPSSAPAFAVATTQVEFWYAPAWTDSLLWNMRRCHGSGW